MFSQPVFQGNQIGTQLFDLAIDETAMRGIDVEIARNIGNLGSIPGLFT